MIHNLRWKLAISGYQFACYRFSRNQELSVTLNFQVPLISCTGFSAAYAYKCYDFQYEIGYAPCVTFADNEPGNKQSVIANRMRYVRLKFSWSKDANFVFKCHHMACPSSGFHWTNTSNLFDLKTLFEIQTLNAFIVQTLCPAKTTADQFFLVFTRCLLRINIAYSFPNYFKCIWQCLR